MEAPQWLYDLMELLDLDIVEQSNWVRRWNGDSQSDPRPLSFGQTWKSKDFLLRNDDRLQQLLEREMISERSICQARAQQHGLGFVDLNRVCIEPSAFTDVSFALVTETGSIPVKRDGNTLWLAVSSPNEIATIDAYKLATGCRVVPVLAVADDIDQAIEQFFLNGGSA